MQPERLMGQIIQRPTALHQPGLSAGVADGDGRAAVLRWRRRGRSTCYCTEMGPSPTKTLNMDQTFRCAPRSLDPGTSAFNVTAQSAGATSDGRHLLGSVNTWSVILAPCWDAIAGSEENRDRSAGCFQSPHTVPTNG